MKPAWPLLLLILLVHVASCSKDNDADPAPDPDGDGSGVQVREKEIYYAPGETVTGALHQFSYDASRRLSKARYSLKKADGTLQPGSYDSLVYSDSKLAERYGFQWEQQDHAFHLETKLLYQYKDNVLDSTILWVYEPSNNRYTLAAKTAYTYVNGKEAGQRVTASNGDLLNRYENTYQGSLLSMQEWYDQHNAIMMRYTYHYTNNVLTSQKHYDVAGSSSIEVRTAHYEYKNGQLHKETFTTSDPNFPVFVDSAVYRY